LQILVVSFQRAISLSVLLVPMQDPLIRSLLFVKMAMDNRFPASCSVHEQTCSTRAEWCWITCNLDLDLTQSPWDRVALPM